MNNSFNTREPSILYLNISFLMLGVMQVVSILLSSTLILAISLHRPLHTVPNLLTANSSFAILIYAFIIIAQIIVGLQRRDKGKEGLCIFLAYFTSIAADAICYSYLVTAISQYFFNILYRRKGLLTFAVHWLIIFLSWFISCLLPLFLYLSGQLQYAPEMHICSLQMSVHYFLFLYMGTAIGIPLFGIITIYFSIVRYTRRTNTMVAAVANSTRNMHVLKNILTLVGILGFAGLPSLILVIWNAISMGEAPVPLYLVCALTISFCTNLQITFIFAMNRNVRTVLWNRVQGVFH